MVRVTPSKFAGRDNSDVLICQIKKGLLEGN